MALVVETIAVTVDTDNDTSKTITMPSGIVAGDLLLCLYTQDGNDTITFPADWVAFSAGVGSGGAVGSRHCFKIADGGDALEITAGNNQQASAVVYRISGWDPDETVGNTIQIQETTGSGDTSPDPPSLTPNGGNLEYLIIAMGGCDRRTFDTTTPTDYGNLQRAQSTGANGSSTATAERLLTTSSAQDPGVFGIASNDEWTSATVIVHPAGLTPVEIPVPVGALTFTGEQETLDFGLHPAAGALVFAGDATNLQFDIRRDPAPGALVFGGDAPAINEALQMTAGALTFAGQAPVASENIITPIPAGALVFAGQTPVRDITKLVPVPAGALVFGGLAPTLQVDVLRAIPVGALTFAGQAPSALVPVILEMGVGAMLMVNPSPTLGFGIDMPVDDEPC